MARRPSRSMSMKEGSDFAAVQPGSPARNENNDDLNGTVDSIWEDDMDMALEERMQGILDEHQRQAQERNEAEKRIKDFSSSMQRTVYTSGHHKNAPVVLRQSLTARDVVDVHHRRKADLDRKYSDLDHGWGQKFKEVQLKLHAAHSMKEMLPKHEEKMRRMAAKTKEIEADDHAQVKQILEAQRAEEERRREEIAAQKERELQERLKEVKRKERELFLKAHDSNLPPTMKEQILSGRPINAREVLKHNWTLAKVKVQPARPAQRKEAPVAWKESSAQNSPSTRSLRYYDGVPGSMKPRPGKQNQDSWMEDEMDRQKALAKSKSTVSEKDREATNAADEKDSAQNQLNEHPGQQQQQQQQQQAQTDGGEESKPKSDSDATPRHVKEILAGKDLEDIDMDDAQEGGGGGGEGGPDVTVQSKDSPDDPSKKESDGALEPIEEARGDLQQEDDAGSDEENNNPDIDYLENPEMEEDEANERSEGGPTELDGASTMYDKFKKGADSDIHVERVELSHEDDPHRERRPHEDIDHATSVWPGVNNLYVCGYGESGQCGNGSRNITVTLKKVEVLEGKDITDVAHGHAHTICVTRTGEVFSFGEGKRGQLGHGDNADQTSPVVVDSLVGHQIISVACTNHASFALTQDGAVLSWGEGTWGELGHGPDIVKVAVPTAIVALKDFVVTQISCGKARVYAITEEGFLFSWGRGEFGTLGHGDELDEYEPRVITNLAEAGVIVTGVSVGKYHTAALSHEGIVFTWGSGDAGMLGHGDTRWRAEPVPVKALAESIIVTVVASTDHTAALSDRGEIFTWGHGSDGKLGHGDGNDCLSPRAVAALENVHIVKIGLGRFHTAAVTDDGELYTWGSGYCGNLGLGEVEDEFLPSKVESLTGMGESVFQLSCGKHHTAVITNSGKMYTFGFSKSLQLSQENIRHLLFTPDKGLSIKPLDPYGVRQISCGLFQSAALTEGGRIFTWGCGAAGQLGHGNKRDRLKPTLVKNLKNVVALSCGTFYTAAVTESGQVYTWGNGRDGRLGHGNLTHQLRFKRVKGIHGQCIDVSCGANHTAVVTEEGDIYTWGNGEHGKLGYTVPHEDLTQLKPRRVEVIMEHDHTTTDNPQLSAANRMKFVQVECGFNHTAAVTVDGKLYTFGYGGDGKLGHGDLQDCQQPTLVESLTGLIVSQVACGSTHTMAVTENGTLFVWGDGPYLGNSRRASNVPTKLPFFEGMKVKSVAAGEHFSCVVTENGSMYTWGSNVEGRLGHGGLAEEFTPRRVDGLRGQLLQQVACGSTHVLAVDDHGRIFPWGKGDVGQLGIGVDGRLSTPQEVYALSSSLPLKIISGPRNLSVVSTDFFKTLKHCQMVLDKPKEPTPTEMHALYDFTWIEDTLRQKSAEMQKKHVEHAREVEGEDGADLQDMEEGYHKEEEEVTVKWDVKTLHAALAHSHIKSEDEKKVYLSGSLLTKLDISIRYFQWVALVMLMALRWPSFVKDLLGWTRVSLIDMTFFMDEDDQTQSSSLPAVLLLAFFMYPFCTALMYFYKPSANDWDRKYNVYERDEYGNPSQYRPRNSRDQIIPILMEIVHFFGWCVLAFIVTFILGLPSTASDSFPNFFHLYGMLVVMAYGVFFTIQRLYYIAQYKKYSKRLVRFLAAGFHFVNVDRKRFALFSTLIFYNAICTHIWFSFFPIVNRFDVCENKSVPRGDCSTTPSYVLAWVFGLTFCVSLMVTFARRTRSGLHHVHHAIGESMSFIGRVKRVKALLKPISKSDLEDGKRVISPDDLGITEKQSSEWRHFLDEIIAEEENKLDSHRHAVVWDACQFNDHQHAMFLLAPYKSSAGYARTLFLIEDLGFVLISAGFHEKDSQTQCIVLFVYFLVTTSIYCFFWPFTDRVEASVSVVLRLSIVGMLFFALLRAYEAVNEDATSIAMICFAAVGFLSCIALFFGHRPDPLKYSLEEWGNPYIRMKELPVVKAVAPSTLKVKKFEEENKAVEEERSSPTSKSKPPRQSRIVEERPDDDGEDGVF